MKRTYFLDKIHNANIREFERIINTIVTDLNYEEYPYTYFKNGNKWLIEVERENDLISIVFDDYSMATYNTVTKISASYSNNWQNIFNKFLHKNQKYYYKKGIIELKNNAFVISAEEVKNAVEI